MSVLGSQGLVVAKGMVVGKLQQLVWGQLLVKVGFHLLAP
jgi:hypothetical protein